MYQPPFPVQVPEVLDRIIKNSYLPLTNDLIKSGNSLSVNINASLTEMLINDKNGEKVVENLRILSENKQIEFLESGAYHPIFPLLPKKYIDIHIKMNNSINKNILGNSFNPTGVFPPELALNFPVAKEFSNLGYSYTLASDPTFGNLPFDKIPYFISKSKNFFVIRRNRYLSNDIAFRKYRSIDEIEKAIKINFTPVIGMDWETFGEHHSDYIPFLIKTLAQVPSMKVSDYLENMKQNDKIIEIPLENLKASSWSTDVSDINHGIPYPLWDHPSNVLHQLILVLMDILDQSVSFIESSKGKEESVVLNNFFKSQQSCQLWWCSDGRFGPSLVRRAISFQVATLKSIKTLSESYSKEKKQALEMLLVVAEKLMEKINFLIELKSQTFS
jgi:alpha-amylase/alpha-mannosidase (GH57 family)